MNATRDDFRKILLWSGLTVALAFASGCAPDRMKPMSAEEHQKMQSK